MSVARVTEVIASSPNGVEGAVREGVRRASKTLDNIQGVWVSDIKCLVEGGEVKDWRCTLKTTFVLND